MAESEFCSLVNDHDHDHDHDDHKEVSFMNLTDCLQSSLLMDYNSLEKVFQFSPYSSLSQPISTSNMSQVLNHYSNLNVNPNSPVSSSSNEKIADEKNGLVEDNEGDDHQQDVAGECSKKLKKEGKSKEEKREKEAKVAFMTKSDIDHLEDGYRWRKYGQKAVKNSSYPRSYYRCTTQKCNVKKRVERSFQDPSVVITTYQGKHNHPIPTTLRGSVATGIFPQPFYPGGGVNSIFSSHHQNLVMMHHNNPPVNYASMGSIPYGEVHGNSSSHQQVVDYGLLQDIVPSMFLKHEP